MNWFQSNVGVVQPEVWVIFFSILLVGFVAYGWWARPKLLQVERDLTALKELLNSHTDAIRARTEVSELIEKRPSLGTPWHATQARVLALESQGRARGVLLGTVEDVWRVERLLQRRFNLAMFEAVPNIAVGVGLLFTFGFLTLALTDATAALSAKGNINPVEATNKLLGNAGGKFLSSLAGLLVSLVWTVWGRRRIVRLERAAAEVVEAIETLWPPIGAEAAVAEQLIQLGKVGETLSAQQGVQTQLQATTQDQVALTEELLVEAREQTGSLKRFETDLAVSIGNAITNSFGPQMEQMTQRLEQAITHLSDRIGTMNEDALRKMMDDFSQMIRSNTDSEMEKFKETLVALAGNLQTASDQLRTGVGGAADALGEATRDMTSSLANAAQGLVESVKGMDDVMDKARASVQEVDATLVRAAAMGTQGMTRVEATLETTDQILQRMSDSGAHWLKVSSGLQNLSAGIAEACDAVEELAQEQKAVVASVRSATPEALQAVSRMSELLDGSTRSAAQSMGQVQSAMDKTSKDLSSVVSSISDGVVQYTQQVAQLHQAMDAEMAKAVGKLGGAIQNLDDTIGELNDSLDDFERKR
jgi:methyl-accepting chemotaxis protein